MSARAARVGLFLRGGSYAYQDEVVIGAHQECSARGVDLFCLSGGNVTLPDPRNFAYALPDARTLDAAIFVKGTMGAADGDPAVRALVDGLRPLPICMIGSREPGVLSVVIDNSSGVRALTRHLIEKHDCRRIAFVTGHGREAEQRLAGYRLGHRDRGRTPDERLTIPGDFRFAAGQDAVARLFDGDGPGCDAIVAANDWMALGILEALRARRLRVPEDIAVVGFDDVDEARFATPPLTTVRQAPRQLGIEAVRLVLAKLAGDPRGDVMLETVPQIRQSCGCFRGTRRGDADPGAPHRRARGVRDYAAWARATAERGPAPDPALPGDWAERMVAAIRRDLEGTTGEQFLAEVDEIVEGAADLGNVSAWHQPVATLRREVVDDLPAGSDAVALAESIFERAHILIGDHAERTQGRRRLETEEASRALEELGADVRTSLDRPSIGRALAKHLPGLHVRSCTLIVPHADGVPASEDVVSPILRWDHEKGMALDAAGAFRAGELLPESLRPPRRHTLVLQPLFFQSEALGWCMLEMDPPRAAVCEAIPAQVSAALKATALQERLVAEATMRERAERSRLEHEIELAARIQTGILPREPRVSGLSLAASMIPAAEVGGDYFDILPFDGGCWLGIGDVAGHGLHAGLVMMMIQSIVSAITHDRADAAPSEVWRALNAVLCDNVRNRLERDEHATLTLIRYDDSGRLVYAGAHEEIVVYRAAQRRCERLKTRGVWAGVTHDLPDGALHDDECRLEPGDTLLLYTDGVTEAMNAGREVFGIDRLTRTLERAAGASVDEIRDRILAEVRGFMSDQRDDLTLVVLRYR